MRQGLVASAVAAILLAGSVIPAAAQQSSTVDVGQEAPDFALAGATRYGVLRDSIRLSDFRGKTVVLAFFFKARTKG